MNTINLHISEVEVMTMKLAAAQELRREIATGRRVGPRLVVAGNLLDGPQITWPGSTLCDIA